MVPRAASTFPLSTAGERISEGRRRTSPRRWRRWTNSGLQRALSTHARRARRQRRRAGRAGRLRARPVRRVAGGQPEVRLSLGRRSPRRLLPRRLLQRHDGVGRDRLVGGTTAARARVARRARRRRRLHDTAVSVGAANRGLHALCDALARRAHRAELRDVGSGRAPHRRAVRSRAIHRGTAALVLVELRPADGVRRSRAAAPAAAGEGGHHAVGVALARCRRRWGRAWRSRRCDVGESEARDERPSEAEQSVHGWRMAQRAVMLTARAPGGGRCQRGRLRGTTLATTRSRAAPAPPARRGRRDPGRRREGRS